jgi:hypothetical protein
MNRMTIPTAIPPSYLWYFCHHPRSFDYYAIHNNQFVLVQTQTYHLEDILLNHLRARQNTRLLTEIRQ